MSADVWFPHGRDFTFCVKVFVSNGVKIFVWAPELRSKILITDFKFQRVLILALTDFC